MLTFIEYLTEARGQSPFREKAKELYGYLKAIKGVRPYNYRDKITFSNVEVQKAEFGVEQTIKLDQSKATNLVDAPIDAEFTKMAKTVAMILGIKSTPKVEKKFKYERFTYFHRTITYTDILDGNFSIEYIAQMDSSEDKLTNHITHRVTLTGKKAAASPSSFSAFSNVMPGTIFSASWGYDMTIVEYWQVVKRTGKSVYVRPIASKTDGDGHAGNATPIKDSFTSSTATRCVLKGNPQDTTNKSVYININGHHGRVWDGKPNYYNTMD